MQLVWGQCKSHVSCSSVIISSVWGLRDREAPRRAGSHLRPEPTKPHGISARGRAFLSLDFSSQQQKPGASLNFIPALTLGNLSSYPPPSCLAIQGLWPTLQDLQPWVGLQPGRCCKGGNAGCLNFIPFMLPSCFRAWEWRATHGLLQGCLCTWRRKKSLFLLAASHHSTSSDVRVPLAP